jgi:LacI family transcriptional regulator
MTKSLVKPSHPRVLMALGYYDLQLHRGITRYAREAGWVLDTSMAHYSLIPDHWHGDGIVTILIPERPDLIEYVKRQRVPVVALYGDVPELKAPRVVLDDVRIGRIAAEHLLERGFSHLGFLKFSNTLAVCERERGFRQLAEEAGADYWLIDWHAAGLTNRGLGWFDWLKRQLAKLPTPIGIMVQSDHRAPHLMSACEAVGLIVPDQVAVIGVDNDEQACELAAVPISSVDCNREMMAYEGARLLDSLMRADRPSRQPIVIAPKGVVVRQSSDIFAVADPAVSRAMAFIREHSREPIGVDDVVKACRASRCGLYRAFARELKRSIGDEIDRQRVEQAKRLLANSQQKLGSIARYCGFSGAEHFTRVFQRTAGVAPSIYRKRLKADVSRRKGS